MAKFCIECRFYHARNCFAPLCTHDKAVIPQKTADDNPDWLVCGPSVGTHYLCRAMRSGICGAEAALFEPHPPRFPTNEREG